MRYFCYLSQDKVDQFLSSFEEREILESEEKSGTSRKSGVALGISHILTGNYSFGRSDMFHKDVKYRENAVQKLLKLLKILENSVEDFQWEGPLKANSFYFMDASFRLEKTDKKFNIVSLTTSRDQNKLVLNCSLKHFSSTLNARDAVNSTNGAFFAGEPLWFETVFFLTHKDKETYIGTPLFLALSSDSNVLL